MTPMSTPRRHLQSHQALVPGCNPRQFCETELFRQVERPGRDITRRLSVCSALAHTHPSQRL